MPARILDGKRIADELLDGLKARIDARVAAGGSRPGLAVVLVGGDPASQSYVRNKRRAAQKIGIEAFDFDRVFQRNRRESVGHTGRGLGRAFAGVSGRASSTIMAEASLMPPS